MTLEALNEKTGRRTRDGVSEAMPIGETDADIFDCPSCARPLALGTSRCPGCGTRLLAGVQAGRALGFVAVGLAVGLLVGGGGMAVVQTLGRVQPTAGVDGGTTTVPTAGPSHTAMPVVTPAPVAGPTIPTAALSALRQTALVNQRLATSAGMLTAALAAEEPSSADIARILRSMSTNATSGQRIAADIGAWEAGTILATDLSRFYAAIHSAAEDALGASLRNEAAYVVAGTTMLAVVDDLSALDATARTLAAEADIDLPVVDLPSPVESVSP